MDGTVSFARGQKYSTIGIALFKEDKVLMGAIISPFERELYVAEKGKGSWLLRLDEHLNNGISIKRINVSSQDIFLGGVMYVDAFFNEKLREHKLSFLRRFSSEVTGNLNLRMTGSNMDQQRQVACGRAEVTLTDEIGGFHDIAAGSILIKEAGGMFTDLNGKDVNPSTTVAIGSNGFRHDDILTIARKFYL